jgi:hypothetical protein
MFNDILNKDITIHKSIVDAAIEWVEYELNRIYSSKTALNVSSLQGEAEKMLSDRLGTNWKKNHKVEIMINLLSPGKKDISVKIKKWE